MPELIGILQNFGPLAAILAYFLWRDHRREEQDLIEKARLETRITEIEDYQRNTLERTLRENTEVVKRVVEAIEKCQMVPKLVKVN
jgi:hypothetical protein